MTDKSHLMAAYGFVNKDRTMKVGGKPVMIEGETPEDKLASIKKLRAKYKATKQEKEFDKELEKYADHYWQEVAKEQEMLLDYPTPTTRYIGIIEYDNLNIEQIYHWLIKALFDLGFSHIDKVTDIFTASEHSSFYGAAGQRLGLAQEKVSNYLAVIGKMVKDLFAMVRELRWIDERLMYYKDSEGTSTEKGKEIPKERQLAAEQALKGLWVDMVDGVVQGQRTGGNLFTMAQQLQFTTLPDLFFHITPKNREEVDEVVEKQAGEFNKTVKLALKRKLYSYLAWKESTYREMQNRRTFTLRYLKQHYQVIRMYINWVKPYLKHIEKLTTGGKESHKLISAFEASLVDVELIARWMPKENSNVYSVIMLTIEYRTKPQMQMGEPGGYHRGPIHVGEAVIYWRSYTWTDKQIDNYIAMRNREDMELLTSIDASLKDAMDALGEDLERYLKEEETGIAAEPGKKTVPKKLKEGVIGALEPVKALGEGVKELVTAFIPERAKKEPTPDLKSEIGFADKKVRFWMWICYKLFKKAHGMVTW